MLAFFLYTVLFWVAGAALCKVFYIAIQPEQIFDALFKWQKMLHWMYGKGGAWQQLGKGLGDCEVCYCSFSSALWFALYCLFMNMCIGEWVPYSGIGSAIAGNVIWYFIFYGIQWATSFYFLTGKLFGK